MGTPFISFMPPTDLTGYDRSLPHDKQPSHIPKIFCDAMEVREKVFVHGQGVPLGFEHDSDDARSCHWVVYASVNQITQPEVRDEATGAVVTPRKSETLSQPIGTLRVVPFPHAPHPVDGGWYVDNILQDVRGPDGKPDGSANQRQNAESGRAEYTTDRATSLHDGQEPYVKIGRVAVLSEFRGHKISGQMWRAAKLWLEENPTFFDPSVKELGMNQLNADKASEIPRWNGLVCSHSQTPVAKVYEGWGFQIDEGMGKWWEEGMEHVGMFARLKVTEKPPKMETLK